ncbi:chaplin [Actinomadura fulvescens]|uniref:chaplin n=1 Tax=Actinomadura fulvescens TaxID=46160 RepID=UPI0031E1D446
MTRTAADAAVRHRRLAARTRLATTLIAAAVGLALPAAPARAARADGPGTVAGNLVQVPTRLPANVCGNTIDVVSALNFAAGAVCATADDLDDTGEAASRYLERELG